VVIDAAGGRTPVAIGVHAANKFEAAEYARHAEKIGADAMLALSQTDESTDPEILTGYFTAITSASSLPLIIQVSNPALTVDYLIGLAKKLPTFRYVKEEQRPVPKRIDRYVAEAKGILTPMTGGGSRNLMNEMARGSRGTMPGAGFADIQAKIWDWYQEGKTKEARDLFAKMLMMAVLEQHTGYVLQKEILRRRGVFRTVVMRSTRKFSMDKGDMRELDEIFEVLRPYFKV
jgi:2-keto-3-deoxy-L-arabinonate dehydratase